MVPDANDKGTCARVQYAIVSAEVRAFIFPAEQAAHDLDALRARSSVLRSYENSRVDDSRQHHPKPGIQYVPLLVFNASCIDHRRFPVETTPSSTAPAGQGLVGLGQRYGSEVLAALNDSSAGDPPIDRIFSLKTAIPNYIAILLRLNVTAKTYTGEMTVSEILPEFQISQVSPTSRYL